MKLLKNRAFAVAVAAILTAIAVFIGLSSAIPSQSSSNAFVSDGAGVLSSETEEKIFSMNKSGDGNFYVVTVKSTGKYDLYDWALKTAEEWRISSYSSILLVMQPSKDDYQLIYGSDFEAALSGNSFSAFLGKYIEPYFAAGDYNGAALSFCSGAAKLDADWNPDYYGDYYDYGEDSSVFAGIVALIIIFVFVIVIVAIVSAVKNSPAGTQSGSFGNRSSSSGFFWGYLLGSSRHRHIHMPPPPPGPRGGFGSSAHRTSSSFRPSSGSSHRSGGFSGGGRSGGGFSGGGRSGGGFSGGGRRR